jgi:hypothetical protein
MLAGFFALVGQGHACGVRKGHGDVTPNFNSDFALDGQYTPYYF